MKCKFFSALLSVLLMFVGVSMNAQSYVPNAEAQSRINKELTSLYQTSGHDIKTLNESGSSALEAEISKSLKIQYGKELIVSLKQGAVTADAIVSAENIIKSRSNETVYNNALQNAIVYFKDLLQ